MPTLLDELDALVAAEPAKPLLTWSTEAARVELSAATLANWVAKTAGLIRDDLDVQPGDAVHLDLGPHWLAAVLPFGVWRTGGVLGDAGSAVVFTDNPECIGGSETIICPTDPFALTTPVVPSGWVDMAGQLRAQPDEFHGRPPEPRDLAAGQQTHFDLLAAASQLADELGLQPDGRLLLRVGTGYRQATQMSAALAAAVTSRASLLVLVGEPSDLPAGEWASAEITLE